MLEITQISYILLAVYSFCFGAILGMIYDTLRITRIILGAEGGSGVGDALRQVRLPIINGGVYPGKKSRLAEVLLSGYIALGDIAFISFCGVIAVMISYAYNSGRVRAVIFLGLLAGFLLYYYTVGRLVVAASRLVAFAIRGIAVYAWSALAFLARNMSKVIKFKKKGAKKDAGKDRKSKQATCQ